MVFPMTLNDPAPSFKVTPFFDAEYIRNGTRYRHGFNEILIKRPPIDHVVGVINGWSA